jgi:hypothetical protein
MIVQSDLFENADDLVSVLLRRFASTDLEWFFEDFAESADDYPEEVHEVIHGLTLILAEQDEDSVEAAERELASVGVAFLALYDLTRPERATDLTLGQDAIARALIEQASENRVPLS